jgi:hypothetical protein
MRTNVVVRCLCLGTILLSALVVVAPPALATHCAPYQPGEFGAGAPTLTITDTATEASPLQHSFQQGPGDTINTSSVPLNIQIDSLATSDLGLYIRYEFPDLEDHDLYVLYPSGNEAALVAGFNPTPFGPFDGTGTFFGDPPTGGHSEVGAEQLDGLRTINCQGWTLDLVDFLGEGGTYTVSFWLGAIQHDPAPDAP